MITYLLEGDSPEQILELKTAVGVVFLMQHRNRGIMVADRSFSGSMFNIARHGDHRNEYRDWLKFTKLDK